MLNLQSEADVVQRLGIDADDLHALTADMRACFKIAEEMTKKGKMRKFYKCTRPLKKILKRLHRTLIELDALPPEMMGGVRGKSIFNNAEVHRGQLCVLNLDLQNFFPSVGVDKVRGVFRTLGCSEGMVNLLSFLTTADNHIPQGFPTSPILSAFVLRPLADDLRQLLSSHHLKFTLWIDDLTISGSKNPRILLPQIRGLCAKYGLTLNEKKVHLGKRGKSQQAVTGVKISNRTLSVGGQFARDTERMIHYLKLYGWGMVNEKFKLEAKNAEHLLQKINGRILHINRVNQPKATKFQQALVLITKPSPSQSPPPALVRSA